MQSREICEHITARVIEAIERGGAQWVAPYSAVNGGALPMNPATGSYYHGVNVLALWAEREIRGYASNRWLTYKQAQAAGGQVRAGEHASIVVFYKPLTIEVTREPAPGQHEDASLTIPMLKGYSVFNLSQIDGCDALRGDDARVTYPFTPIEAGERMLHQAGIEWDETEKYACPCYSPAEDKVHLLPRARYAESVNFYSTAAHEFSHATGHKTRLDRKPYKTTARRGAYAFEECVAELGSVFLTANLGLPVPIENHAAYIGDWLDVIKADSRAIFKAAAQAQKACDFLLEKIKGEENV